MIGAEKAIHAGYDAPVVLLIGMITGIGGGMMRDVLRGEIPFVLQREIYASAALLGALVFYVTYPAPQVPKGLAMLLGAGVTTGVRLVTLHYKLDLSSKS